MEQGKHHTVVHESLCTSGECSNCILNVTGGTPTHNAFHPPSPLLHDDLPASCPVSPEPAVRSERCAMLPSILTLMLRVSLPQQPLLYGVFTYTASSTCMPQTLLSDGQS